MIMEENHSTIANILEMPLHVVNISATDIVLTPKKDMFLNLPHSGKKNILVVGSDECMACLVSLHYMAGQVQKNMGCVIYKIDSNKQSLTGLFGINYRIPKYFIELENTQLVPWNGNNMNVNQLQHDLQ